MKMLSAVTSALSTVITWVGTVVTALVGESGALSDLLPLMAIGIAISALMVRPVMWSTQATSANSFC